MSHLDPSKLSFLGDSFLTSDDNRNKQITQYQGEEYSTTNFNSGNSNGNHGNSASNSGINYDSLSGGSSQQTITIPNKQLTQKIEFTIETSPDGVNIQSVQPVVETGENLGNYF